MSKISEVFEVPGKPEYDEKVYIDTAGNWTEDAQEGIAVIDLRVLSMSDMAYATLTLKQAKQVRKALKKAIDLFEA